MDPEQEGYDAWWNKVDIEDNPYQGVNDIAALDWNRGWYAANETVRPSNYE